MLRTRHIIAVTAALTVALIAAVTAYSYLRDRAGLDEFAVYEAFLARLSHDFPPGTYALADTSSKLDVPTPCTWLPWELRLPIPPEEAAPPDKFIHFCGSWCGHEFIRTNLQTRSLNPGSRVHFSFDILPATTELRRERGKHIVSATRPGFDLRHHRAVFTYSFHRGSDETTNHPVTSMQSGCVLLEKEKGAWRLNSYDYLNSWP